MKTKLVLSLAIVLLFLSTVLVKPAFAAPPQADDDAYTMDEDTTLDVDSPGVLGNDTDADNDSLTAVLHIGPTNGSLTLNPDGSFSYTPNTDFFGTDSFTYKANDGSPAESNTATVTITVDADNDPPTANDDTASVTEDTPETIDVLDNDSDVDGDSLSVSAVTQGTHGTVTNNGSNVTYSPETNYSGPDSFTYTASDGKGGTDTATVTITVGAANDPPTANNDTASTTEDTPVDIDVLANDSDVDGDSLSVSAVTQGTHGTVTNNGSNVTYSPDTNYSGPDSFTYTASDGKGGTDTASVTITVGAVNDPPTANDDTASTTEDTPVDIDVLANDSDVDGDSLSVSAVTQAIHGTVTNNGTDVTYSPDTNYSGPDSFTYTASDGKGGTDTASVTITVGAANDPPTANDDTASTNEDTPVDIDVLANDSDVDGDSLSVSAVTQAIHGIVTNNGTDITYSPDTNYSGPDSFTYTASDGKGGTDTATVTITVGAVNDPPTANDDTASTTEDTPVDIDVLANDSDVDGDSLSVSAVTQAIHGTVTNNGTDVTYSPDTNYSGPDSFTYTASDGKGGTDTATVTITVGAVNDPPTASNDSYSTNEDTPLTVTAPGVLGNDTDPEGNQLTAVKVSNPTKGSLSLNANGSFSYIPNANFNGSDSFTYRANDGSENSNVATVNITVNSVNDPPTANDDTASATEDTPKTIDVLANDSDVDGDSLSVSAVTQAIHGTVTNNGTDVTYSPDTNYSGPDSFTYTASDGKGGTDTATVTITVGAVNDPPTASNDSYSTNEDTPLTVTAPGVLGNDTDPEGNPLTAVKVSNPTKGSLSLNANGSFSYTPNANFNGSDSFTYRANDGSENSNVATVNITVNSVNDPPTASNDSYSTNEDTPLTVTAPGVLGNDTDADGDPLTAALDSTTSNGTLTLNPDGSFSYTPNADFSGSDSFTYRVNDGSANSNLATVTINISEVNDPPVAVDDAYTIDEDTTLEVVALGVLANDTDPEGNPLTAVKVSNPTKGSLSLNANGSFSYIPNANFNGSDSFTYRANDGSENSNLATVNITVNSIADPPTATDDAYTIDEDIPLNVAAPGVLANDTDPDGDPLTAIQVDNPTNGTLTLNSDGSFTYEPNLNFFGIDSFTYFANDGTSNSNLAATVTITVNPVADPPVATDDAYTIDEDTTLTIAAPGLLANDTDPDGDPLTAILVDNPTNGTFTLNSDGSFIYEPNLNFFGTDSFTYTANDGTLDSDLATVTITVNPVVDPPIADAGPDQTVGENTTVTLGGSNSFDTEGETLSYRWDQIVGRPVILSNPQAANPTFTAPSSVASGGELLSFQLTVTDEEAAQVTDTAIVNVTLPLANRPPTADAGVDREVEEDTTVTLDGSNSFDPDGDNVSFQWDQIAGPPVTLLPDPTADKPTFEAPFVESAGVSFTFELTVTDTSGLQATDTTVVNVVNLTLPSANTPPAAVVGDDQTVDEDVDDTVTLNGSNSFDPEGGNLFYRWRQVAGRPVTLSDPAAEQPTFPVPNVGLIGVSLILELTVIDVDGLQAVVDTLVNVAGDDDFPIPDAGDDQTVNENSAVTLDGLGSVDPEGENLSYSWRQVAGYPVTLSDPSVANPTLPAPNVTPNGITLNFELTVTDVVGLQDRDEVEISVFGDNDTPIADAGDDQTVLEKSTVTMDASNSFDPDVDDLITYQWNQTGGTSVTLSDPTSKLQTFEAPSFDDAGGQPLIFELIVTDGQNEQSQEDSTTVTVTNFQKTNKGASGGGCFIATVAYGSPMDSHVNLLREFRDRFLLTNPLGEEFMELYYTFSPPLAGFIAKYETLRKVARCSLLPFAAMASVMLHLGAAMSLLSLAPLLTILLLIRIGIKKRRE